MKRTALGPLLKGLLILAGGVASSLTAPAANALPAIVVDAATGEVIWQKDATQPWYPASLTKLMTAFVALKAVQEGRLTLETPIAVTARAARMPPSKMGFTPGSLVTLDNALKMLMVKSANDIAVTIAEGVSGSVEAFADEMNASARALGMRESHFVNPNGLPAGDQVTSARDMAVLGRALYHYFPEHAGLFSIGALRLGGQVIPTHNGMLGRYPGADGMKTGFTCAAGFNLVASATRGGRKLIVAVMGAPNPTLRTAWAATLLDNAFAGQANASGAAQSLPSRGIGAAPDQRNAVCRNPGATIAALNAEIEDVSRTAPNNSTSAFSMFRMPEGTSSFAPTNPVSPLTVSPARQIASLPRPYFDPTPVYLGPAPGWNGPVVRPSGAPETQTASASADETAAPAKRGAKTRESRKFRQAKIAPLKVTHERVTGVIEDDDDSAKDSKSKAKAGAAQKGAKNVKQASFKDIDAEKDAKGAKNRKYVAVSAKSGGKAVAKAKPKARPAAEDDGASGAGEE